MKVSLHTAQASYNPLVGQQLFLTAFAILICSLLTCFSTFFQSMLFHWSFSCIFTSFSPCGVIEILVFIGHTSIHATRHHRVSQLPFGLRQILNLYTIHYKLSFAFYSLLYPLLHCYSLQSFYQLMESIGLTKFHITNNCKYFRSHL